MKLLNNNHLSLSPHVSDGLHTPSCGLSLWQHQDGEVPSAATGSCEQQDEGKLSQYGFRLHVLHMDLINFLFLFTCLMLALSIMKLCQNTLTISNQLTSMCRLAGAAKILDGITAFYIYPFICLSHSLSFVFYIDGLHPSAPGRSAGPY